MASTKDNLEAAFAGESQAFQKYTNYADKAKVVPAQKPENQIDEDEIVV